MISDDELVRAIDRIALTPDGEHLYRYLQRVAQSVLDDPATLGPGALSAHDGRRRFALELMQRMAKGIDERGGRSDHSSSGTERTEQPVVFTRAKPVALTRGRPSIIERISESDPELAAIRADNPAGSS